MNYSHPALPRRFDDSAAMFREDYKLMVIHACDVSIENLSRRERMRKREREKECRASLSRCSKSTN